MEKLDDLLAPLDEPLHLGCGEADHRHAVDHADGRRHRTAVANDRLEARADVGGVRRRQAVDEERRLERDNRTVLRDRVTHLFADHARRVFRECHDRRSVVFAPYDERRSDRRLDGAARRR